MNVVRFLVGPSILKLASAALIVFACSLASADSSVTPKNEPGFGKSKYPKIQVRHMPLPKSDEERQVPAKGTPRTELPVMDAPGPKGGKMIRVDNTYLVQCPPAPSAQTTNAPVRSQSK